MTYSFQVLMFNMFLTVVLQMPNCSASCLCVIYTVLYSFLILLTFFQVNLELPFSSPLLTDSGLVCVPCLSPVATLCFFTASCILSLPVPKNRWFGLTQARLSHLWQAKNPGGIGPTNNWYATRCPESPLPFIQKRLYPFGCKLPFNVQHSLGFLIKRLINRSISVGSLLLQICDDFLKKHLRQKELLLSLSLPQLGQISLR